MGYKSWVRVARCQLLVICLFIMVLSVGFACLTIITGLGSHFTTFTEASPADNPIRDLHSTMILYGSFICGLLLLTLLLSTMSVLRESQYLMATAFVGFGFLFCALMAGLSWTQACQNQVDASVLDVYDDLYDQALTGYPKDTQEHLLHVHKIFQCCGKTLEQQKISTTHITCSHTDGKDCVSVISDILRLHWFWVRTLLLSSLGLTVYGMVLSSFLYFSLPRGNMWERRGEYSLNGGLISPPNSTVDTPLIQLMPYRSAQ
ncbi:tetraspanin-32 isoform X1 [Bufo bufo]|uniref:tetraspanin-32 isoform X1 n=1 Tax=Bufo bufo TaxID=8384 RepID=UPI001ABE0B46|nr:tetraspanin-32 isoform X1 [Bufo bufo]